MNVLKAFSEGHRHIKRTWITRFPGYYRWVIWQLPQLVHWQQHNNIEKPTNHSRPHAWWRHRARFYWSGNDNIQRDLSIWAELGRLRIYLCKLSLYDTNGLLLSYEPFLLIKYFPVTSKEFLYPVLPDGPVPHLFKSRQGAKYDPFTTSFRPYNHFVGRLISPLIDYVCCTKHQMLLFHKTGYFKGLISSWFGSLIRASNNDAPGAPTHQKLTLTN